MSLSPIIRVGGSQFFDAFGGQDATIAFESFPHSEQARKDLQKYAVGRVEDVAL